LATELVSIQSAPHQQGRAHLIKWLGYLWHVGRFIGSMMHLV
jgi:CYTH domain-containing protein